MGFSSNVDRDNSTYVGITVVPFGTSTYEIWPRLPLQYSPEGTAVEEQDVVQLLLVVNPVRLLTA